MVYKVYSLVLFTSDHTHKNYSRKDNFFTGVGKKGNSSEENIPQRPPYQWVNTTTRCTKYFVIVIGRNGPIQFLNRIHGVYKRGILELRSLLLTPPNHVFKYWRERTYIVQYAHF